MSYLVAKQPDGNYAIFSSASDSFIYTDEPRENIIVILAEEYHISSADIAEKIRWADDDMLPYTTRKGNGNERWNALSECNKETLEQSSE